MFLAAAFVMVGAVHEARADEWGCTVILCLSNPAGATAAEGCAPPVEKFWHNLRRGGAMPHCDTSDATGPHEMHIGMSYEWFDPCPAGLVTTSGLVVQQGQTKAREAEPAIGEGRPGPRACVGRFVQNMSIGPGGDSGDLARVAVYDLVEWQEPAASPQVFSVVQDGVTTSVSR